MKNNFKSFIAISIMILISFAILEVILRFTDPLGVEYFSEVVRYFSKLESRDNYSYIHPAGMNEKFQGVSIITNSYGLRGPEFSRLKPAGKKRLMILGDSIVLGWGVEYGETFPNILQEMFNNAGMAVEVIPVGVSSWNTRTEYEYLKAKAIEFDPDVLVLMTVSNDTDPKENSNIEIDREKLMKQVYKPNADQGTFGKSWFFLVDKSYLFRHIQFLIKLATEKDQNSDSSENDSSWKDSGLALTKMIELCRNEDINFIPYFFASEKMVSEHPIYRLYRNYYNKKGIKYNTFPDLLFEGFRYRNSVIDNHPDPEGHKIMADEIFNAVKSSDNSLSFPDTEEK